MEYLVKGCNEIYELMLRTLEPSRDDLERVFTIACNTLKELAQDKEFFSTIDKLNERRNEEPKSFAEITQLDHFVDRFHQIERTVLLKAGLREDIADHLLKKTTDLLEYIRGPALKSEEVRAEIVSVRGEACLTAQILREQRQTAEEKKKNKKRLGRCAYTIGGAVMIFANGSGLALSLGMSAPGTVVSAAAGGALISHGVKPSS
jgi:hypothetical protein